MNSETPIMVCEDWRARLDELHGCLSKYLGRKERQEQVRRYLDGLLSNAERKNGWQLAEITYEAGPQAMQRLLNAAQWDEAGVRTGVGQSVGAHLGAADGVFILDETGFLKNGVKSAGVARQYSGTAGRIENQQIGVFMAYATREGCAFLDCAVYIPEEWLQNPERCREAGIPMDLRFQTKPQLAPAMLERATAAHIPARWVVADSVYSSDELRLWLQAHGYQYGLAVTSIYSVWQQGQQVTVAALIDAVSPTAWVRLSAGDGSQGPRYFDWTWLQLPYDSAPGFAHWLVARRSLSSPHELAYFHAYAPATTRLAELVRVVGARWHIEVGFEPAKGELGLDHYEVRHWRAWYRHMTLVLVAYAFLAVLRQQIVRAAPSQEALSLPELRRLMHIVTAEQRERQHRLRWLRWRRQHQATTKRCHQQRRHAQQPPKPIPLEVNAPGVPGLGPFTHAAWQHIAPLLPRPARVGRPIVAHRTLLEAMLWIIRVGAAWHTIPQAFAPWQTVYTRYKQWLKSGLWAQIVRILGTALPSSQVASKVSL